MIPRSKIRNQPRWRYLWFSLALPVGLMLLLVGCAGPLSVPLERTPAIYVEPESAKPGSLVVVIGSQWQPNEVVLIDLVSVYEGEPISDTFAVARTGDDEIFIISFLFPTDKRWTQADSVQVTAHSVASDREATADLSVVAPKVSGDTKQSILFPMVATGGKQPVSAPAVGTAQVSSSRVNLRAGPSTAYAVLTVLSPGISFSVLGQSVDTDWLRIRLGSGLEGWVARVYTDFDATVPIIRVDPNLPDTPSAVEEQIWLGEYYSNRTLEGKPALVRRDQNVKFDRAYAAPAATLQPDDFSARWTRLIYFPAGAYRFHLTFDDGVRMWIGNELVIDEWSETSLRTVSVERTFKTADARQIRIEYFEATERAHIDFWWARISNFPEWRGAYYDNDNLVGAPVLLRNDPAVDFTWGQDSPGAGVPRDNFSVRWMRTVEFDQDIYRFRAQMDDGLRLFVDGNLIIDEWHNGGAREVVANYALNKGLHAIRVEHREITGDATAGSGGRRPVRWSHIPTGRANIGPIPA